MHVAASGCLRNQGLNETYAEMEKETMFLGAEEQGVTVPNLNPSIEAVEVNGDQIMKSKDPFARLLMAFPSPVENKTRHNNLRIRIRRDGKDIINM